MSPGANKIRGSEEVRDYWQAEGSIFKPEAGHSFSLYGPTLSRQITYLFFSSINLSY